MFHPNCKTSVKHVVEQVNIKLLISLGVDADHKTRILDDSGIVGKILVGHNVLHKLF